MSKSVQAGNNIESVLNRKGEEEMDEWIDRQLEELQSVSFEAPDEITGGTETEFFLLDEDDRPVTEEERDEAVGKNQDDEEDLDNLDHELGVSMAENASNPQSGKNILMDLYRSAAEEEKKLRERSSKVIRHGANPAQDPESIQRTSGLKYQEVPAAYGDMRVEDTPLKYSEDGIVADRVTDNFGRLDSIDPRNESLPAAIASTQLNIQADGVEDGFEKANIGYAIAPYITALSGNARFLGGSDLGFNDVRMELWEKAFDIGNLSDDLDIGKLDSYYEGLKDNVERIKEQPRILNDEDRIEKHVENEEEKGEIIQSFKENPLDLGQGMFWKDSRVKLVDEEGIRNEVVVEFRQNSIQPTVEEDIAVHAFYIGRVIYEQEIAEGDDYIGESTEDLPDISKINENRYNAMRNGLDAELHPWDKGDEEDLDTKQILEKELDKAVEGLKYEDGIYDPGFMEILYDRLETGKTPSDEMAEAYYSKILEDNDLDPSNYNLSNPEEIREKVDYNEITEEERMEYMVSASQEIRPNFKGNKVKAV